MPWDPKDATRFTKKANTPKKKRQFAEVSNKILKATGDEGRAIRGANAAVAGTVKHAAKHEPKSMREAVEHGIREGSRR